MAEKLDLYTILKSYAQRTRNPRVHLETFIRFLQANASSETVSGQRLSEWATDTRGKIKRGMEALVRQQKVEMGTEDLPQAQTVYLPYYFAEIVQTAYANIQESADCPLPDERMLKLE
ncbi:MAG: hypothetical protein LBC72_00940, partial [Spirochaetaceae bacterium]|nr:hypothetical protein [Spirochaetaceae bacterium]